MPKLSPKSGNINENNVMTRLSMTVLLRPIRFMSRPVGIEKIRNQKNTNDGKMLACESVKPKSAFT